MVEIRRLKPLVKLKMPTKELAPGQPSRQKITRRLNRDFPPPTPQPTPCRLWQGVEGTDGYGRRKMTRQDGSRVSISMHRWVWEQLLGRKLLSSEVVLHACDNRLCYRLSHLSIGTVADNNADMKAKGRAVKPPQNVFHGECHPMAKLSEAQVRLIRGHYQSGLSTKTIAAAFDISPTTVRRVLKGVTWTHLGDATWGARAPTRDLIAEAQERLAAERLGKIKPIKRMNL